MKDETTGKFRVAQLDFRFGEALLPEPRITTAWIREHALKEHLRLRVVKIREAPTKYRPKPLRWLLYTTEQLPDIEVAMRIVRYYELRWTIEDCHKCWKTGCALESRCYETADRLTRVAAVTAVLAVRLLRMRTAASAGPPYL